MIRPWLRASIPGSIATIPGTADVHVQQLLDLPTLHLNIERNRVTQVGMNARDVAQSVLVSLSGTSQVTPNYWVNPGNRVNYTLAVQTPTPGIAVRCSTISLSGSVGRDRASLRLEMNQRASSRMVRTLALDNPVFINARGINTAIFDGVSGPVSAAFRRPKIAAAAFADTL